MFMFVLFLGTRMFPMLVGEFYVLNKLYGANTVGCMLMELAYDLFMEVDRYSK